MTLWRSTPLASGRDWRDEIVIRQLFYAARERGLLGNYVLGNPLPTIVSGGYGNSMRGWHDEKFSPGQFFQYLQGRIIQEFNNNPGTGYPWLDIKANPGDYDNKTPAQFTIFTLASALAVAGINAAGFTRIHRDAAGTARTDRGVIQSGDFKGPILVNEIQALLNLMRREVGGIGQTNDIVWWDGGNPGGGFPTWAAAKADAEANYAVQDPAGAFKDQSPYIITHGFYGLGTNHYTAEIRRAKAKWASFSIASYTKKDGTLAAWSTDFYGRPAPYGGNLDIGSDVFWHAPPAMTKFASLGPSNASPQLTGYIGDVALPSSSWCDAPTALDTNSNKGYTVDGTFIGVANFDFDF